MTSTSRARPSATASAVADGLVSALLRHDPGLAGRYGLAPDPSASLLPDLSSAGGDHLARLYRDALTALPGVGAPTTAAGSVTAPREESRAEPREESWDRAALEFHAAAELDLADHDDDLRQLTTHHSPVPRLRTLLQPVAATATSGDSAPAPAAALAARDLRQARLAAVPAALAGYRQRLAHGHAVGVRAGSLQVREAVDTWRRGLAGGLLAAAPGEDPRPAATARAALHALTDWLERTALPGAPGDAVGPEVYARALRRRSGGETDPVDVYAWALDRHSALVAEQETLVRRLAPGTSPGELLADLARGGRTDLGNRLLTSDRETLDHLDRLHELALARTRRSVADIPADLEDVRSEIGRPGGGVAAHYRRPGPDGRGARTVLPRSDGSGRATWTLRSLWHHEGAPGHHVQLGGWVVGASRIGRYRSSVASAEATTEGWAMYAETVMARAGELEGAELLGYLDGQLLRAARVIVDIGLHVGDALGLKVPDGPHRGEPWSPAAAVELLGRHRAVDPRTLHREVVRYLSWPAQATCYALGERSWWELRTVAESVRGSAFDARAWHTEVLAVGALPFDALATLAAPLPPLGPTGTPGSADTETSHSQDSDS